MSQMEFTYKIGPIEFKYRLINGMLAVSAKHLLRHCGWYKIMIGTFRMSNATESIVIWFTPTEMFRILRDSLANIEQDCIVPSQIPDAYEQLILRIEICAPFVENKEYVITLEPFAKFNIERIEIIMGNA